MMTRVSTNGPCDAGKPGHSETRESIDIRSIMVQQEAIFKEQVQALHRLYKVQKREMQELNSRKNQSELETALLTDGFSTNSGLEERSGALVRPIARWYKQELGSLSLHPFCSLKLFDSSGSISSGGSFERLDRSQHIQTRGFDLDKFLEDWVDESVIEIQRNYSSTIPEESENACNKADKGEKSNGTPEDSLSSNWTGKVVSGDSNATQDSSLSDHMDQNVKLSHQGSFASVNGCLNSSSSEGEENSSKVAAAFKMTEGTMVLSSTAEDGLSKMKPSGDHQTPPSRPQHCSPVVPSEGHSKFVPEESHELTPKTSLKGGCENSIDMPDIDGPYCSQINSGASPLVKETITPFKQDEVRNIESKATLILAGLAPNTSVQRPKDTVEAEANDMHGSSAESLNPWKRKHLAENVGGTAVCEKLTKITKSVKRVPGRSAP